MSFGLMEWNGNNKYTKPPEQFQNTTRMYTFITED
jgi:hypothetical protein